MKCKDCGNELNGNVCYKCKKIDMQPFAGAIQDALMDYLKIKTPPAFGLCFMLPGDEECHWTTNVSREDGITLFLTTGLKMKQE